MTPDATRKKNGAPKAADTAVPPLPHMSVDPPGAPPLPKATQTPSLSTSASSGAPNAPSGSGTASGDKAAPARTPPKAAESATPKAGWLRALREQRGKPGPDAAPGPAAAAAPQPGAGKPVPLAPEPPRKSLRGAFASVGAGTTKQDDDASSNEASQGDGPAVTSQPEPAIRLAAHPPLPAVHVTAQAPPPAKTTRRASAQPAAPATPATPAPPTPPPPAASMPVSAMPLVQGKATEAESEADSQGAPSIGGKRNRKEKRPTEETEVKGAATPTRTVASGEAHLLDKAAGSSGRRDIMTGKTAIEEAAHRKAVTPHAKLPEFPAPVSERPDPLVKEETRRATIRLKEDERRAKALEGKEEADQKKLHDQWAAEDALEYRTDPDDHELEIYPAVPPYAYVQIVKNTRTHATLYHVIEPKLSYDEKLVLGFVEQTLVDVLDLQPEELEKDEIDVYIRKKFDTVIEDYSVRLGDDVSTEQESKDRLLYYVLRDFIGEGPIDVFMHDPMIEDISCDGPHQPIFIYHRKYEALTTTVRWSSHAQLDSFVIRLAQRAGKHVSIAEPILDATMRDGSRLQATLAKEVSTFGSSFTIRKFRDVPFSPVDLARFGTMSSQMLAYLWMIIGNRQSGIYSGGTASGKTTAINAIMLFIPPSMKVITIEDTRELSIPQPNWIAGLTRGGFGPRDAHGRQAGEIDMFQLLKNALRQRPEYIIVGEVRGAEAYNLFQAMATGHAAYGTMHADSVDAVIHRLESDPINIPRSLLEALDVVCVQIQTRVGGKRVRRTKQITEIVGLDPNTREILTNEVFHWEPATDEFIFSGVSYSLERIAAENGLDSDQVLAEMDDRRQCIDWMIKTEVREYKTAAAIINAYWHDKKHVMKFVTEGLPWQG